MALRQGIFNSLTAQSRNDGTSGISLESRWYAVRSWSAQYGYLKHSKNNTVNWVGYNTKTRQVLVMGIRQ